MAERLVPKRQYTEDSRRRHASKRASCERSGGRGQSPAQGAGQREAGYRDPSKSDGVLCEGVAVKYAWIDAHRDQFNVSRLCRVLAVSRSGYCQWRTRPPSPQAQANAVLDAEVAAIHRASRGSYGRARIVRQLRAQGLSVGAERVRRSLQRQRLRPVYKRPYRVTTDSAHNLPVAPNLLDRRFGGWQPNQAWVSDIAFVVTDEGWLFLAAILDLSSRRIVGWSMSERMRADLVCQALRSAYWQRKPPPGLILHSDRGSQYASRAHRTLAAISPFFVTVLKIHTLRPYQGCQRYRTSLESVMWSLC